MTTAALFLARAIRFATPLLSIGLCFALVAGFLQFVNRVHALQPPEAPPTAEAIVVLTGGTQGRLDTGLELLRNGAGERLLISGVNRDLSDEALHEALQINPELAACCVDLGRDAQDTLGNASETAAWAQKWGYQRVLLVTDDYHMPRSYIELRLAMPGVTLLPYPVETPWSNPTFWGSHPGAAGRMAIEYGKFLIVRLREAVIAAFDANEETLAEGPAVSLEPAPAPSEAAAVSPAAEGDGR
jgi:uncharacterized SAM-binding protein YcdF (DUF218 family)